ncbi:MAG: glycine cleavage T C-terminal barrel domain-containing protein, partial [Pseudomonadota bacterium]
KDNLQKMIDAGPRRVFVTLAVEAVHAPAFGGDSILKEGELVGTITSGAWGHRANKNLAMGFVDPEYGALGTRLEIELLGQTYPADVIAPCQIDPENRRVRRQT